MHACSYRGLAAFSIIAALMLVPVACGGDDDEGSNGSAAEGSSGTTISATLGSPDEYDITLDNDSGPAGEVTFTIKNEGQMIHEFEIVKTDVAPNDLPVEAGKADVEAEGGEEIDEVEDIAAGAETELKVDLEPGSYLLLCNLPGHYEQGMVIAFTVE